MLAMVVMMAVVVVTALAAKRPHTIHDPRKITRWARHPQNVLMDTIFLVDRHLSAWLSHVLFISTEKTDYQVRYETSLHGLTDSVVQVHEQVTNNNKNKVN